MEPIHHADAALREGRISDAISLVTSILESEPDSLEATLILGVGYATQQQNACAWPALKRVAEQDPRNFSAFFWLSRVHRAEGRLREALIAAERAVQLNPQNPQALNQLGVCLIDLELFERAESCLRQAVKLAPSLGAFHVSLGVALDKLRRPEEAKREFKRAVAVDPGQVHGWQQLADMMIADLNYAEAKRYAEKSLEVEPNSVLGHLLLSKALVGVNEPVKAADEITKALELDPLNAEALAISGTVFQSIGRLDDAMKNLRRSLEIEPRQGYPYYALVRAHRGAETEISLIERMQAVVKDPLLGEPERGEVQYALGKAYADIGDYKASMEQYDEANRTFQAVKFGETPFDRTQMEEGIEFLLRNVDGNLLKQYGSTGSQENLPVFVVGMIRSGTTLAEQILSCHPQIGAAGELRFWLDNRYEALQAPGNVVNVERLDGLQSEYIRLLRMMSPDKARVIDKMPGNYMVLGLIHLAFPKARIIHMRRNPIDTCLSIWMTPNRAVLEWATKEDVVFAYEQYQRMMEHWRGLLPSESMMDVQYEELVLNPERIIRQMVDFCELPWDDACLKPEQNQRSVATPSAWQVHQPMYTNAVERWRKYEPWLGEFNRLLSRPNNKARLL